MKIEQLIILGAVLWYLTRERNGAGPAESKSQVSPVNYSGAPTSSMTGRGRMGFLNKSAEPNFPFTGVAGRVGAARGWYVYSDPISTNYLNRVHLTT